MGARKIELHDGAMVRTYSGVRWRGHEYEVSLYYHHRPIVDNDRRGMPRTDPSGTPTFRGIATRRQRNGRFAAYSVVLDGRDPSRLIRSTACNANRANEASAEAFGREFARLAAERQDVRDALARVAAGRYCDGCGAYGSGRRCDECVGPEARAKRVAARTAHAERENGQLRVLRAAADAATKAHREADHAADEAAERLAAAVEHACANRIAADGAVGREAYNALFELYAARDEHADAQARAGIERLARDSAYDAIVAFKNAHEDRAAVLNDELAKIV